MRPHLKRAWVGEHLANATVLAKHVTANFRVWELPNHTGGHHNRFDDLLTLLGKKHGDEPADQFGPRKLDTLRDGFITPSNAAVAI